MNPQYLPPQQFSSAPQSFPPNRSSPSLMPQPGQTFQNVPLGPPKSGQAGPPQRLTGVPPQNSTSGQYLPNIGGQVPRTQIPQSQLPPSQSMNSQGHLNNPFGTPPIKQDGPPANIQNDPTLFQNGPSHIQNGSPQQFQGGTQQFQNGSGQTPPLTQTYKPPLQTGQSQNTTSVGLNQNNTIQYSQPGGPPMQTNLARPPSNQSNQLGHPPMPNAQLSLSNQSNQLGHPSMPGSHIPSSNHPNQLRQPPMPGAQIPPSNQSNKLGHPSMPIGQIPSNQLGHPPMPAGQMAPSTQASHPPTLASQQPPSNFGQTAMGSQYNQQSGGPQTNATGPNHSQLPPRAGPPVNQNFGPPIGQPPQPAQGQPVGYNQSSGQTPYQYSSNDKVLRGPQMPPLPGQPPYSANQLPNQMQNMNLNSQRQYPGGPMKAAINGDSGPHMLPALNQPGYINGAQMRSPPVSGYPPMPGQGQAVGQGPMPGPSGPGAYPQPNYQQQQQIRRLDPDQMPSPIQVTLEDQQNRSGVFITNQKGLVPPLISTNFVVQDQGNASPRFVRSTMYNVPISQDIIKQTAVPFSLVISPMARHVDQEYPPPIVNFGELGPVRCIRCKAYMCPFMQFIDSGRRFQCLFCKATTDVPTEYFQHLDHTGQRMDRYERPELVLGTYEFVATADYCRNNTLPKSPAIIFVIDVSYNNIKSGLVHLLCSQMKEIIQNLPSDQGQEKSNMKVGFITYNSSVHFYNIKGTLAAPQMLVVGDVHEMFMPLLDGFLCTPEESAPLIDALMEQIPAMFGDTRETETVLLPAIQAGLEALKASECAGKLLVFHSTLPSAEAPGKLRNRDDRKLLGTDKEKTILTPQNQVYNQLGQDCVAVGCSVDLFVFNNAYIDLATIGQVVRLTGGEIFKYTYFQADIDGERLINDVIMDISRPIAFDGIMRVRTSTGVRPTDFYGHFYMSNTTDMELASIDADKAVAVEIKHDDKLSEDEGVYIQVALLYTSCSGQRRLRIINLSLKTCSQMTDLYRSCDLDTMVNYISKQAVYKLLDNNPKLVKDSIVNRAAQVLATYRKNCATPSSAGQLILPECMKLLPLYVNCLLKSDALSGGSDMTIDDRSFMMQAVMTMDIPTSVNYFYPRLIPLQELDPSKEPITVPSPIRTSIEKISEQGVYILENGIHMFLWFGLGVNPEFIQMLFGAPSAIQVDIDRPSLPELDNPLSLAVRSIIDEIRIQRHRCMKLTVVRQREKLEAVFKHFLVEDRGTDASPSYVDFLCHLHKEIRTILS